MNAVSDMKAGPSSGDHPYSALALWLILGIIVCCSLYICFALVPQARTWRQLTADLASARRAVAEPQEAVGDSAARWRERIAAAEARRAEAAAAFLTESQAAGMLTSLHASAAQSGVVIASLQDRPGNATDGKAPFDLRTFDLEARGPLPGLISFVAGLREAAALGLGVNNLSVSQADGTYDLRAEVVFCTSPYAPDELGPAPAIPTPQPQTAPTPPAPSASDLEAALAGPWVAEDWPQAIALIERILAIDPAYGDMMGKLYAAHVNYGYQLMKGGDTARAVQEFVAALQIRPDGGEAEAGLAAATSSPES